MIQFNLLPDVKLEYVKARKMRHAITTVSLLAAGGALAVLFILFSVVHVAQRSHLNRLSSDIEESVAKLQEEPDLDRILTIQNQLNNLTGLHQQKIHASRLQDYIARVTPADVTFSDVELDFEENTLKITGEANTMRTVNQFVDTLKFTTYTLRSETEDSEADDESQATEPVNAFMEVVLADFGRDDEVASYEISMKFDPIIFDNTQRVSLRVPSIVTTRSLTERPQTLFQPQTEVEGDN